MSYLINVVTRHRQRSQGLHPVEDEIPQSYQVMLFWAGLRGAVGVALAAGLDDPESSPTLKATVLIVVVLTVIIFGGTTARMLEIVGVRTNVVSEDVDSDDESILDHPVDLEDGWDIPFSTNGSVNSARSIPLEPTPHQNMERHFIKPHHRIKIRQISWIHFPSRMTKIQITSQRHQIYPPEHKYHPMQTRQIDQILARPPVVV